MNRCMLCVVTGAVALSLVSGRAQTYREWLLDKGVEPTIKGFGAYDNSASVKTNAFDGESDGVSYKRENRYYSTTFVNGCPTLTFGGEVDGQVFEMKSYRLCRQTSDELQGAERAPTAWILEGADASDGPWTLVERRSDVTNWGEPEAPWLGFNLVTPVSFRYYKITFTASRSMANGGGGISLMEIEYRDDLYEPTLFTGGKFPNNAAYDVPAGTTRTFSKSTYGRICRLSGAGDVAFTKQRPSDVVTICAAEAFTGTVTVNSGVLVAPKSLEGRVTLEGGAVAIYKPFAEMAEYVFAFSVDGYAGATPLENFPVLVRLPYNLVQGLSPAAFAALGGSNFAPKIRAAAADSDTEYPCDVETWEPKGDGEALIWVRLPSLAKTGTTFRLLVGCGFSSFAAGETWRRAEKTPGAGVGVGNFAGVWHMATMSNMDVPDASGNGLHAEPWADREKTTRAAKSLATNFLGGVIGVARQISSHTAADATDHNALYVAKDAYNAQKLGSVFTASCWARRFNGASCYASNTRLFHSKNNVYDGPSGWEVQITTSATPGLLKMRGPNASPTLDCQSSVWREPDDEWDYYTFVYDGTTYSVYTNGALIGSKENMKLVNNVLVGDLLIGGGQGRALSGEMDETRLYCGAQSADWIAADYATQKNLDFLSVKSVEQCRSFSLEPDVAFSHSVRVRVGVDGSDGTPCTVTLTAYNSSGTAVTNVTQVFSGGLTQAYVELEGLAPKTSYSVVAVLSGALEDADVVSMTTTSAKTYKMLSGDFSEGDEVVDPSGDSSMSTFDPLRIHSNNWQNVDASADILDCLTNAATSSEFLIDAMEKVDPTEGGVWALRTSAYSAEETNKGKKMTFWGKRLTIVGDRKDGLTYARGGGVMVRGHDGTAEFPELVLKNASVWIGTRRAWNVYIRARLVIPAGYSGFLETWRTDPGDDFQDGPVNRKLYQQGSIEGAGTLVFCQAGDGKARDESSRGFYFQNDWSYLTGKIEFNRSVCYEFRGGFKPPADCPTLTPDGILLDNRYHNVTETFRSAKANALNFRVDATFATPNRGITVTDGDGTANEWNVNAASNVTVTLRNPLYGSGALGMKSDKYGTLRLEGAQGDWSGTFTAASGTLVLAGAKPLGEGALKATGNNTWVELDAGALKGGACYLKALSGTKQILVKNLPAEIGEDGVAFLTTSAAEGVTRSQIEFEQPIPEPFVLRSTTSGGIRTFSVGKKSGVVIIVR